MELQVGSTVGDYQILEVLGAGGMGSVYKVRNVISDRVEALKILLPDLTNNPELAERFQREIKVLGSLDHPNIAQLRTAVRNGNQLLMVMEFVDGETLDHKLKSGPMAILPALDATMQVLSALEFAHGQGIVHRDIKPANMMLTRSGMVKLMDFGIAKAATDHKLTMTGTTMGSLYYMSPEQIQGMANLDARSDLYSVGVTLYQLVTGRRPFDGDSQYAIMAAHLQNTPVPPVQLDPNMPQVLNDVILMSVAKEPGGRFQTAGAFRNALAAVAGTIRPSEQPATAPAVAYPPVPTQPVGTAPSPSAQVFLQPPPQQIPTAPYPAPPQAGPTMPSPVPPQYGSPGMAPPYQQPMPAGPHYAAGPQAQKASGKSRRGLWMAVGGVAVAAAVIAVIQFGPWKGAKADSAQQASTSNTGGTASQPQTQTQPAIGTSDVSTVTPGQTPATTSDPGTPSNSGGAATPAKQPSTSPKKDVTTTASAGGMMGTGGAPHPQTSQPQQQQQQQSQPQSQPQQQPQSQPQVQQQQPQQQPAQVEQAVASQGPSREELLRFRERMGKMHVRANAIRDSLQGLKQAQQAQGMRLNARFTQPEGLMNTYIEGANDAINQGDLKMARDYANKAERQIEILEKLLNL